MILVILVWFGCDTLSFFFSSNFSFFCFYGRRSIRSIDLMHGYELVYWC